MTPVPAPAGKHAFLFGILALFLPALSLVLIWFVSLDKDYAFLVYAGTVALSVPPSIITGVWALWRAGSTKDRGQAWTGLILGLLATCIYVIGGLAFCLLLTSVLRHD
jgi:hypothetical protein